MERNSFLREPLDVTIESQKFLSCVARFQQRKESFGIDYTVKVLCGSNNLEEGHNQLSTYGIGIDKGENFWRTLYGFLLKNKFVAGDYSQIAEGHRRPVLILNCKSWEILKGHISVVVESESWRSSLTNSQNNQNIRLERRSHYDIGSDNEESSVESDGYDFSEEDFVMDYHDSYEEEIDYGYLSDIENYDAY